MNRETFFNSMSKDYDTNDGRELSIIDELQLLMTEQKHKNPDFYKNIIFLCWNYLQELNGIKDENGEYILKEIKTPFIDFMEQGKKQESFLCNNSQKEKMTPFELSVKELDIKDIF